MPQIMLYNGCMKTSETAELPAKNKTDGAEYLFYIQTNLTNRIVRSCECSEDGKVWNPWRSEDGKVVFCCVAREICCPKVESLLDWDVFYDVLTYYYKIKNDKKALQAAYESYLLSAFIQEILPQLEELDQQTDILREKLNGLTSEDGAEITNTQREINRLCDESDKLRAEALMAAENKLLEFSI